MPTSIINKTKGYILCVHRSIAGQSVVASYEIKSNTRGMWQRWFLSKAFKRWLHVQTRWKAPLQIVRVQGTCSVYTLARAWHTQYVHHCTCKMRSALYVHICACKVRTVYTLLHVQGARCMYTAARARCTLYIHCCTCKVRAVCTPLHVYITTPPYLCRGGECAGVSHTAEPNTGRWLRDRVTEGSRDWGNTWHISRNVTRQR